jgi:hypothetical protein
MNGVAAKTSSTTAEISGAVRNAPSLETGDLPIDLGNSVFTSLVRSCRRDAKLFRSVRCTYALEAAMHCAGLIPALRRAETSRSESRVSQSTNRSPECQTLRIEDNIQRNSTNLICIVKWLRPAEALAEASYTPSLGRSVRTMSMSCTGSPSHSMASVVTGWSGASAGKPVKRTRKRS